MPTYTTRTIDQLEQVNHPTGGEHVLVSVGSTAKKTTINAIVERVGLTDSMKSDIANAKAGVETLNGVVQTLATKQSVEHLSATVDTKATKTELSGYTTIAKHNQDLAAKADVSALAGLATKGEHNTLKDQVDQLNRDLGTKADVSELYGLATKVELSGKVDKEEGKGLSTNDFTNELKTKLDSIANTGEVNLDAYATKQLVQDTKEALEASIASKQDKIDVGSFATTTALTSGLDAKVNKESGKGLSTNDFTNELKAKLDGLQNVDTEPFATKTALGSLETKVEGKQDKVDLRVYNTKADFDQYKTEVTQALQGKVDNSAISPLVTEITSFLKADGSRPLTGNLDAGTNKIIGLKNPDAATDAATKGYVDTTVAASAADTLQQAKAYTDSKPSGGGASLPSATNGQVLQYTNGQWAPVNISQGSINYDISRGSGLVTNGTAFMKNNYNFSNFEFNSSQAYSGYGSFSLTGTNFDVTNDEPIPVDLSGEYEYTFAAKVADATKSSKMYSFVDCLDIDGLQILPQHVTITNFRLARPLKNGDTSVWVNPDDIQKVVREWGNRFNVSTFMYVSNGTYTSQSGFRYPEGTYSRLLLNGRGQAANTTSLNRGTGEWTGLQFSTNLGQELPAGSVVNLSMSGGTYVYWNPELLDHDVPAEWKVYTLRANLGKVLRPWTALIRLGWLCNRGGKGTNTTYISSVQLRQVERTEPVISIRPPDGEMPAPLSRENCDFVARVYPMFTQYEFTAKKQIPATPASSVGRFAFNSAMLARGNKSLSMQLPRGAELYTLQSNQLVFSSSMPIEVGDKAVITIVTDPWSNRMPTNWTVV